MPVATNCPKLKKEVPSFKIPQVERARSANSTAGRNLRKSSSYQNLKAPIISKSLGDVALDKSSKRPVALNQKHHGSAVNLQSACADKPGSMHALNGLKSKSNAHRISVNSDLLSRVEKEKKQYEARISELTQVTETRKMEIERLTFEIRRLKEDAVKSSSLIDELKQENASLISQLGIVDGADANPSTLIKSTIPPNPNFRKPALIPYSPPESVGTTTRLTPSGATTGAARTTSSLSCDWNEQAASVDLSTVFECLTGCAVDLPTERVEVSQSPQPPVTVATLQGRLIQMEEANYTTNEELQATLQELWDLQRSVDEAHEETHNLAFERAILLEALSTQTCKLEHCRFQIEQLKHLLLTDRRAQTTGSRENHFCELYASIEHEKQVLLSQNNDLAQSNDSLSKEYRILTEKTAQLQDNYDRLEGEHASLKAAFQTVSSELSSLKGSNDHANDKLTQSVIEPHLSRDSSPKTTHICNFCDSDTVSRLQLELRDAKRERNEIREQYDLLRAERERETTEWRLYERDLLKTVQVADGIKSESEAETQRLLKENEVLRKQVEKLTHEANTFSSELNLTKEKLANLSKLDIRQTKLINVMPENVTLDDKLRISDSCTVQTSKSSEEPTQTRHLSSLSDTDHMANFANAYSHRRSTNFGHNNHLHPCSGSPGAPLRSSCLTTGPTVRSLIQSIENQVKAVQHQKRALSSKPQSSLTSTCKTTSSLRLLSRSACTTSNASNNSTDRSRLSTGLTISSSSNPVNLTPSLRATHLFGNSRSSSSTTPNFVKENTSAPGGPSAHPLLATGENPRKPNGGSDGNEKHSDSIFGPVSNHVQEQNTHNVTEVTRPNEDSFSPSRRALSLQGPDLVMTNSSTAALSSNSKHTSLERPGSPTNRLDAGVSRRYSTEINATKCTSHGTESSVTVIEPVPHQQATSIPDAGSIQNTTSSFPNTIHQLWQDPLQELARRTQAGSKRNALLLWCKSRVAGYRGVEVTNFSSSWNNGLALCALLHTYIPSDIPWDDLVTPNGLPVDKRRCFEVAFKAAESVGIPTTLKLQDILNTDRPDWNSVMAYVTSIYLRYEVPAVPTHNPTGSVASVPGVIS